VDPSRRLGLCAHGRLRRSPFLLLGHCPAAFDSRDIQREELSRPEVKTKRKSSASTIAAAGSKQSAGKPAHSKRQCVHVDHHGGGFICTDEPLVFVLATLGGCPRGFTKTTAA
jgi:hypothetical protein